MCVCVCECGIRFVQCIVKCIHIHYIWIVNITEISVNIACSLHSSLLRHTEHSSSFHITKVRRKHEYSISTQWNRANLSFEMLLLLDPFGIHIRSMLFYQWFSYNTHSPTISPLAIALFFPLFYAKKSIVTEQHKIAQYHTYIFTVDWKIIFNSDNSIYVYYVRNVCEENKCLVLWIKGPSDDEHQ